MLSDLYGTVLHHAASVLVASGILVVVGAGAALLLALVCKEVIYDAVCRAFA